MAGVTQHIGRSAMAGVTQHIGRSAMAKRDAVHRPPGWFIVWARKPTSRNASLVSLATGAGAQQ
jgi:hypothetical protein